MMRFPMACALLLGVPVAAFANTYTVGSGTGCTHASLQAAVAAAAINPGSDEIRLTMPASGFTAQAVVIDGQVLRVVGGFTSCLAATPTGRTRLDGSGAPAAAVISVVGRKSVDVSLERLELFGGDNTAGSGGGLYVGTTGLVSLKEMLVAGNVARVGGGIGVEGPAGDRKTRLRIGDGVVVRANRADSGGGIHVLQAALEMDGLRTSVQGNDAAYSDSGRGGGIALVGTSPTLAASADIGSGGDERIGSIVGNTAGRGGGLYVEGHAWARLYTSDIKRPVRVEWNKAWHFGGGIYAQGAPAMVEVWDGWLRNNHAETGGGALLAEDGAVMKLRSARDGSAPVAAVPCWGVQPCTRITDNESMNGTIPKTSAVVMVINRDAAVTSHVEIDAAQLSGNTGASLFGDNCEVVTPWEECAAPKVIALTNSLIAPNVDTPTVVSIYNYTWFTCVSCTIADIHGIVTPEASPGLIETNGVLTLAGTIVWEPLRPLLGVQVPAAIQARDLILHDLGGFPAQPDIRNLDPRFLGAGDYHLDPSSPALDGAVPPPTTFLDLEGAPRVTDLPWVVDFTGPVDLGAYERVGP